MNPQKQPFNKNEDEREKALAGARGKSHQVSEGPIQLKYGGG